MIYVIPETGEVIQPEAGAAPEGGIGCYVNIERGVLRASLRTPDEATFDAVAEQVGLLWRDEEDALRVARGVTITRLGSHVLTTAEIDPETGEEIVPAVVDDRFHANFWLADRWVSGGQWMGWAMAWSVDGIEGQTPNANEESLIYTGVELIDPDTIKSPTNKIFVKHNGNR